MGISFGNLLQAFAASHDPLSCEDGAANIDPLNKQLSVSDACNHMTSPDRPRLVSLTQLHFLHVYSSG